jgi:parallel beta-helix repeat protein
MKLFYQIFTKKTILSILIVQCSILSFATTYYVSNSGNDSNSGLTAILAWKTLANVNALTFKAGDQILFQKGDTFYGTITVKNSGSVGNPITFGAYGAGANPILTGFTTITGWTNEGKGIYSKTITSESSTDNIVTINGVNTAMGRWPNTGYMTYESHSGNTSITDNQLTGTSNWTGAELVLRRTQWTLNRNLITNHSGSVITYTPDANTWDGPTDGYGYFIQNDIKTLDVLGEWYYNGTTLYMYFGANDPSNYTVKISTLDDLFSSGTSYSTRKNYITADNLTFEGSSLNAVSLVQGTTNWTVKNCTFSLNGRNGIFAEQTSYLTINNNTFSDINNNAIAMHWEQDNFIISNNTISNIGILPGMGASDDVSYDAVHIPTSNTVNSNSVVENNLIQHVGHTGIQMQGRGITVKNNIISDFGLVKADVGGIYTTRVNTSTISNNIILNSNYSIEGIGTNNNAWMQGIYLDDYSHDITISGNTVYNILGDGIGVQSSQNIEVSNNTVFACGSSQLAINSKTSDTKVTGINVHDNIFIAKSAGNTTFPYTPLVAIFSTNFSDINTWGIFNNNYYCRPINDDNVFRRYNTTDPWNGAGLTLAQWQTFSGQDANSHKSPQSITNVNDLQFEYNATTIAKTVTLSTPMIDVKGTKYNSSVTLQPYTSVVLMKDLTPAIVPDAPTSVVATIGNASATVDFAVPANNGSSAITGYTVSSIPSGGVDSNAGSISLIHTITGLNNGTSYTFTVKATNSVGTSVASKASNSVTPKALTATTFTFTGPSSGSLNSASTIFTVTPNNLYTGTITITPTGTGCAGISSKVLTFSNSSAAQTYTITPTVAGNITLTATNNGSLTNPGNLTYSATALVPDAPTSVVATAGDASASVTFVATTNNGGSAITGYNVISNPTGGTDINDGSTSLNHTITGLTKGTSYSFLVKAINPVGSSSYSVASNSITIATGITNLDDGVKIVVFPNPCHGRFTVRFSEIPISESRIEILSLSGRKVTSQIITGISQDIVLFGQPPGMYFVKSILGSIEKINKLVIQ